MKAVEAYPLSWPAGWPRTAPEDRKRAQFGKGTFIAYQGGGGYTSKTQLSIIQGVERVIAELGRIGIGDWNVIISTNAPTRKDGLPRSDMNPQDPGAAVYWKDAGDLRRVMAVDRYDRLADNLGAIAATLEAMRAIERHGGAQILERAFTGFTALPAPGQTQARAWHDVLGVEPTATREQAERAYKALRSVHHPDKGGSPAMFDAVQKAWEQARQALA